MKSGSRRLVRILGWVIGLGLLFALYTAGISKNPPGFFIDESCTAYNAYLLAKTGAGELTHRFPFFFEVYRGLYVQYYHPVEEYLLAVVFLIFPPSILIVRLYSAFLMFLGCLLLGLLAKRISGRNVIAVIIAGLALITPWLFEVGRLAWEAHLVPLLMILFLYALYSAHRKGKWGVLDVISIVFTLFLLTYCYASGRVLGPLMAAGLILFATNRRRIIAVAAMWVLYGVALLPALIFSQRHPGVLMKRFLETSYVRTTIPLRDNLAVFVRRFLEDQNLTGLLLTGDDHARHHVAGSGGAFFFSAFILAVLGFIIVIAWRGRDPWWRFVLYGLVASIIPGAITNWPFHYLRLLALPVFLLVLAIPALEWILASTISSRPISSATKSELLPPTEQSAGDASSFFVPRNVRLLFLCVLLIFATIETYRFQTVYAREGPKREGEFDVNFKPAYDAAVSQPSRPIYLEDGRWGPCYIDALWYATIEKRPTTEFVCVAPGSKVPVGAVGITTSDICENCETIKKSYVYHVFRKR